jgi:hypothetical protein
MSGQHRQTRSALFPDASCGDRHWTEEDLTAWRKAAIVDEVDAINRKLMVPAISIALVLIGCCMVIQTVVYNFRSSTSTDAVFPVANPGSVPQIDWSSPGFPPPAAPMTRHADFPPVQVPAGGTSSGRNDASQAAQVDEKSSETPVEIYERRAEQLKKILRFKRLSLACHLNGLTLSNGILKSAVGCSQQAVH